MSRAVQQGATEITVSAADEMQRAGRAIIVDIRQPEECELFPGPRNAIPVPLLSLKVFAGYRLTPEEADEAPPARVIAHMGYAIKALNHAHVSGRMVLCICRSGQRSRDAIALLHSLGYGRAVNVAGGLTAWLEANLPTSDGVHGDEGQGLVQQATNLSRLGNDHVNN